MNDNYYKFSVKFSLMGEFEIQAISLEEAEDVIKNMSDHEIQHHSDYSFETMEVTTEPELIS